MACAAYLPKELLLPGICWSWKYTSHFGLMNGYGGLEMEVTNKGKRSLASLVPTSLHSLVERCESVSHSVLSTFCDPMGYSLPGSFVHGRLQARILHWVTIPFSRGSSWLRDQTPVSCIADRFFMVWATREAHSLVITHLFQITFYSLTQCQVHRVSCIPESGLLLSLHMDSLVLVIVVSRKYWIHHCIRCSYIMPLF